MRKIYFITLCFLIFLLCAAYNVSYHFMGSKIPLKAETEQTESETVLSAQVNGGDPMPVYSYFLKENQGCVSVYLDDGKTLEIYRNCTDGTPNVCSKLYGACLRIAKNMGYQRVVTYSLASENGASLRASNFLCEGAAGGPSWTGQRRRDYYISPPEKKIRWSVYF